MTVSTKVYEGANDWAQCLIGSQHILLHLKPMYRYYTGVFGNFLRVGDDGDLSVSGSVNQNENYAKDMSKSSTLPLQYCKDSNDG